MPASQTRSNTPGTPRTPAQSTHHRDTLGLGFIGGLFARRCANSAPRAAATTTALALALALGACASEQAATSDGPIQSIIELVGPESPAQAARQMVDPFDPDKRFRGMSKIAAAPWGGEEVYVNIYAEAIRTDSDMGVRGVAARALGAHGQPVHAPLIADLLNSSDKRVRLSAARALQRVHNPAVIPALTAVLVGAPRQATDRTEPPRPAQGPDLDKDVRAAAADALGQYPSPVVLEALLVALEDDELIVADAARRSLLTLTGTSDALIAARPYDARTWREVLAAKPDPFRDRTPYAYPAYSRDRYTWEWLPFFPDPPNESPGSPTGAEPPQARP
jgi:HEAT repeat protein